LLTSGSLRPPVFSQPNTDRPRARVCSGPWPRNPLRLADAIQPGLSVHRERQDFFLEFSRRLTPSQCKWRHLCRSVGTYIRLSGRPLQASAFERPSHKSPTRVLIALSVRLARVCVAGPARILFPQVGRPTETGSTKVGQLGPAPWASNVVQDARWTAVHNAVRECEEDSVYATHLRQTLTLVIDGPPC
jgi:hypothetical protein